MNAAQALLRKIPWPVYALLAVIAVGLAAAGLGLAPWLPAQAKPTEAGPAGYSTAVIRSGTLELEASGSGSVIAASTIDLSFPVEGVIAQLNVQVGDEVKKGQILATLENIPELELAVSNAGLALNNAQETLDDLLSSGTVNLAQSLFDLSQAESVYEEAVKNHHVKGDPRCDPAVTQEYFFTYFNLQSRVNEWEGYLNSGKTGYGRDYILETLAPLRKARDKAYSNLSYCQGYTDQEILESDAALQLAEANLNQARRDYEVLLENSGIDPQAVELAKAGLEAAERQLQLDEANLAGATLTAPIDGVILSVAAGQGERVTVDRGVMISLADLAHPLVQVSVDESDLQSFTPGCTAEVTFDALPERVFAGVVTQVSPVLVAVNNVSAAQGVVELSSTSGNSSQFIPGQNLPLNLQGSVEITCSQDQDVLLAPVAALVQGDQANSTAVYVLNAAGEPEKRTIQIGRQSTAYVEVLGGLVENEQVITDTASLN